MHKRGRDLRGSPKRRVDGRLEDVAQAVGGGYCRLQMPLKLTLGVRETVAGHRLGALQGGKVGGYLPSFHCLPALPCAVQPSPRICTA